MDSQGISIERGVSAENRRPRLFSAKLIGIYDYAYENYGPMMKFSGFGSLILIIVGSIVYQPNVDYISGTCHLLEYLYPQCNAKDKFSPLFNVNVFNKDANPLMIYSSTRAEYDSTGCDHTFYSAKVGLNVSCIYSESPSDTVYLQGTGTHLHDSYALTLSLIILGAILFFAIVLLPNILWAVDGYLYPAETYQEAVERETGANLNNKQNDNPNPIKTVKSDSNLI